ncbi:MAG: thiamine biosynthesis protein ThiS [Deltaproteobacteria bacterium]|nr:thiamine biosynthesis protein ThiS [Deltaproteobacteria bacterium]
MKVMINGEVREVSEGLTVLALLAELGIQKERVAVELNLDIVPKGRFGDTILNNGDRIEIVSFVGGG